MLIATVHRLKDFFKDGNFRQPMPANIPMRISLSCHTARHNKSRLKELR